MLPTHIPRRQFLAAVTISSAAGLLAEPTHANASPTIEGSEDFQYEVTRSLPEWLHRLSEPEFRILRLNQTEIPRSSPLWEESRSGTYCCRGCDLTLYDSDWKVILPIGWVFFEHSRQNAVLTGIDNGPQPSEEEASMDETEVIISPMPGADGARAFVEAHCRRCGSHLGHMVAIEGRLLHCINGASLDFQPA
ncbi:peptide-methionine (R)-S-oxide reductase [Rhodophyticola sp. CCM32]|uniref:peptide-methionine (R)-S-oxide reductase n=1 Tax=Rhodophyticola sp. CCM32 TaxID=2916397 RepID=UPI00107FA301|nr:peptide-methionine (R)-S-oxide reductase [Rhodophyticola sp. CCM32]QBY02322.1 peptide-methionine (R)-S-oxide reductase [Rhodophyticola sp. CCM32]